MDLVNIRKKAKEKAKSKETAEQAGSGQTAATEESAVSTDQISEKEESAAADIAAEVVTEAEVKKEKPKKKKKTKKKAREKPEPGAEPESGTESESPREPGTGPDPSVAKTDGKESGEDEMMDFSAFNDSTDESAASEVAADENAKLAAAVEKMMQEQPVSATPQEEVKSAKATALSEQIGSGSAPKPVPGQSKPPVIEGIDDHPVAGGKKPAAKSDDPLEKFIEQFAGCEAEDDAMEFLRLANAQLADQLDQEREEEELEDLVELICFALEDEEYAIRLQDVREVIKMKDITVVPKAPVYIPGIISLRGQIIPVFDLRKRVGLATKDFDRLTRIIVVNSNGEKVGLIVDVITGVARINEKLIEPTPAVISGIEASFISGVGRYQGRMLIILNLPRVIDAEEDSE